VLPAADLDDFDVLPSRSVLEAADAAFLPVWRFGVPVCESALADDVLVFFEVLLLRSVFDALDADFLPVVSLLRAMADSPVYRAHCITYN
jgi:hypothetical protein